MAYELTITIEHWSLTINGTPVLTEQTALLVPRSKPGAPSLRKAFEDHGYEEDDAAVAALEVFKRLTNAGFK